MEKYKVCFTEWNILLPKELQISKSSTHIVVMSGNNIVLVVTIHESNTRVRGFSFRYNGKLYSSVKMLNS